MGSPFVPTPGSRTSSTDVFHNGSRELGHKPKCPTAGFQNPLAIRPFFRTAPVRPSSPSKAAGILMNSTSLSLYYYQAGSIWEGNWESIGSRECDLLFVHTMSLKLVGADQQFQTKLQCEASWDLFV